MKNIYLIGDSIRYGSKSSKGYEYFLKQKLQDKANIYSPDENCRFAQYTLRGLCDWKYNIDCEKIDIVHWNNGLWDVLRLDGDEPLTPLNVYINMLERVQEPVDNDDYLKQIQALKEELAMAKQRLLDMEYGVEYEWMHEVKQEQNGTVIFNRENAPRLFEDMDIIEAAYENGEISNDEYDAWWMQFIDKDNYRIYALRAVEDHKALNRYDALIPYEDSLVQNRGEGLENWDLAPADWTWTFDGEKVILNRMTVSKMVFVILKVKH